jgi:hypothetical protein
MIHSSEYTTTFISIRVLCPKTQTIILEAQRGVNFSNDEPDWEHLDDVVSTFLDANGIEEYMRLPKPQTHSGGGWVTHTFDMGCPRQIWVFPEPVSRGGS